MIADSLANLGYNLYNICIYFSYFPYLLFFFGWRRVNDVFRSKGKVIWLKMELVGHDSQRTLILFHYVIENNSMA